jgi:diamine N-acetyltransferase
MKKCGFIEENVKRNRVYIEGKYVDTIIMVFLGHE